MCICHKYLPVKCCCQVYTDYYTIKQNKQFKTCKMKLNTIYYTITNDKMYIDFIENRGFFKMKLPVKSYFKLNNSEWDILCDMYTNNYIAVNGE